MKYQVTAKKGHMTVRFYIAAWSDKQAALMAKERIRDEWDLDADALDKFNVFQMDKETTNDPDGPKKEPPPNLPGT